MDVIDLPGDRNNQGRSDLHRVTWAVVVNQMLFSADARFAHSLGPWRIEGYQLLFLISWFGRATAAAWLVPIRKPRAAVDDRGEA